MESKAGVLEWFKFRGKGIGYFGYSFQRLSGVVIVFYLYLHYIVLSNLLWYSENTVWLSHHKAH